MVKIKIDIEYIVIWRNLYGLANEDEIQELENWLSKDDRHRLLYKHLEKNKDADINVTKERVELQWERLQARLDKKQKINIKRWLQYAAVILLPLALGLSALLFTTDSDEPKTAKHIISPGDSKAHLQLADGSFIELDAESKLLIKNAKGDIIGSDSSNVLIYDKTQNVRSMEYNTIVVPRGGEYNLVLADGTRVWLNAETKLTYPTAFLGYDRKVKLEGEALFDVTKSKSKAFIVETKLSEVKVYGTQFNVMCYADENVQQTTLVEGSISVINDNKQVMVQPGQQAVMYKGSNNIEIIEVDTDLYTAWKDGIFRFENMSLEEVASKLSRWYDVDFFFANSEVRNRKITGAMKRKTDFALFMELIEKSAESEITINDQSVLVKGKY